MIDLNNSKLQDLIKFSKGEGAYQDRVTLLAGLTATATALTFAKVGGDMTTVLAILGKGVPSIVEQVFKAFNRKEMEDQAQETYARCRFVDYALARMAVMRAMAEMLSNRERFIARWHLNELTKDQQEKLQNMDKEREIQQVQMYFETGVLNHQVYWDDLLDAILQVVEVEDNSEETFREKMIIEIRYIYEAYKNLIMKESKDFNQYMNSTVFPMILTQSIKREVESMTKSRNNGFCTIEELNSELRGNTDPTIDLTFFNYEEHDFEKQVIDKLSNESLDVLYVKGKTREETLYYLLYILGWIVKDHGANTLIVRTLEDWNRLKGSCRDKLLIPNFYASLVEPIPDNRIVVVFGETDFIGNRHPIELKKRKLRNMLSKLQDSGEIDLKVAADLVERTSGLYAGFKRRVFKGKIGEPGWEVQTNSDFVPALLVGAWTNTSGDQATIARLASCDFERYLNRLEAVINNEDPFLLHFKDRFSMKWRLANVEEAWEVLLKEIDSEKIQEYRKLLIEVLGELPPDFEFPIEKHNLVAVSTERPTYSDTMKKGLIRSLTMLAVRANDHKMFWPTSAQEFVNEVVSEVFCRLDKKERWFALSGLIPDLVEAAPQITLEVIEREIANISSPLWTLFEQIGEGFSSRDYYTNILWALEKMLCFEESAPQAVRILVKLAGRRNNYKLSNSPMSTLSQALTPWRQELNLSIEDKIRLTRSVVRQSDIGWELIKALLPDRSPSHVFTSMSTPNYRPFEIKYQVQDTKEIIHSLREYTLIAIEAASDDLGKWSVFFEKFFFDELDLTDKVTSGVVEVIERCRSDEQKYVFKEIIRDLLYRHRYFRDAKWSVQENLLTRIQFEVFNVIYYENPIYEELHLFTSNQWHPLNPVPYRDNENDFDIERIKLQEARREAIIRIFTLPESGLENLLSKISDPNSLALTDIGRVLASEVHEYVWNDEFIKEMARNDQRTILCAYVSTLYQKHGLSVVQEALEKIQFDEVWAADVLRLVRMDEDLMDLLKGASPEIVRYYWESLTGFYYIETPSMQEEIWNRLLEYHNHAAAFEMLHRYFRTNYVKHLQALDNILDDLGRFSPNSHLVYLIVEAFERLYEIDVLDERQIQQAARQEWAFFNLLIHQTKPRFLERELKRNPELLAQIVQLVYKSSDLPEDDRETHNEQQQQMARQGYSILMQVKFCPCVDHQGNISVTELMGWTKKYLHLVDCTKREVIGRQILGECLAHSPIGNDGVFPHEAVRPVFEIFFSPELGTGFQIGVINSRGAFFLSNGEEEQRLSELYINYARTLRIDYPQLAKVLEAISERYKKESQLDREKASYDF